MDCLTQCKQIHFVEQEFIKRTDIYFIQQEFILSYRSDHVNITLKGGWAVLIVIE